MKKLPKLWPEVWTLFGFALVTWSIFVHGEQGHFLMLAGFLAWIRGDVLGLRREVDGWRKL